MTTEHTHEDAHRIDLLVAHATVGLNTQESAELDRLMAAAPEFDEDAFEQAVALIDRSLGADALEPMQAAIEQELLRRARRLVRSPDSAESANPSDEVATSSPRAEAPVRAPDRNEPVPTRSAVFAWSGWLAAAAAVGFAMAGWWAALNPGVRADRPLHERLARCVATAPDVVRSLWSPNVDDLSGVTGEVVWSDAEQAGFMRFVGLPPNDPSKMQYQLWIVDGSRDENPIDGGVFNVDGTGEIIVPIDARLPAESPSAFAVTREKPGGVVVSAGPLALVAATG